MSSQGRQGEPVWLGESVGTRGPLSDINSDILYASKRNKRRETEDSLQHTTQEMALRHGASSSFFSSPVRNIDLCTPGIHPDNWLRGWRGVKAGHGETGGEADVRRADAELDLIIYYVRR